MADSDGPSFSGHGTHARARTAKQNTHTTHAHRCAMASCRQAWRAPSKRDDIDITPSPGPSFESLSMCWGALDGFVVRYCRTCDDALDVLDYNIDGHVTVPQMILSCHDLWCAVLLRPKSTIWSSFNRTVNIDLQIEAFRIPTPYGSVLVLMNNTTEFHYRPTPESLWVPALPRVSR